MRLDKSDIDWIMENSNIFHVESKDVYIGG